MKKIPLLLICLLVQLAALCQGNQINIAAFKAKQVLPANPEEWSSIPGALILVAQKAPQTKLFQNKLVLTLKQDGAKICGNSAATARAEDSFTVRTYQAAELLSAMGGCKTLATGTYSICAQFFNVDNVPISKEQCANFMVEDKPQADKVTYTPPQNTTPADKKIFTEKDLKAPLTFRWTPILPRSQQPVIYKLRVLQIKEGQQAPQAMKANRPVVEK